MCEQLTFHKFPGDDIHSSTATFYLRTGSMPWEGQHRKGHMTSKRQVAFISKCGIVQAGLLNKLRNCTISESRNLDTT